MSVFDGQADLLAELIAASSTFQTLCKETTVAGAKQHVGIPEAFDEDADTGTGDAKIEYPRAIIADGGIISRRKVGTGSSRAGKGSLYLSFEFEIPAGYQTTITAQRSWFLGKVSTIIREMEVVSDSRATPSGYSTSHLQIAEVNRTNGPFDVPQKDREQPEDGEEIAPLWVIEFEITY